jgi:hypothetical protein
MANFIVTTTRYGPDDLATVAAAMETYIETIVDTKTIRLYTIIGCARDSEVMGVIVVDT